VLIYNQIPTANGASADIVLGAPDFTTFVEVDLTKLNTSAKPTTCSIRCRLLRTDTSLCDRPRLPSVLIWNTIPTANAAPANVASASRT